MTDRQRSLKRLLQHRDLRSQLAVAFVSCAIRSAVACSASISSVPCHGVIGSSGSLTGYRGGLDRKIWLLDHERRWRREPQPGGDQVVVAVAGVVVDAGSTVL